MMIELRQLRYLLAIAETGNFTRAAESLFISQSALSQQIQSLEQIVGTTLLDRSKRGVRLTAAGEILCHRAQHALNEIEQAQVAIQELEGLQRGELRLGVVQTVSDYLMPSLAAIFASQYPNIKLLVEELSADEIEQGLEEGALQIGISFAPPTNPNISTEPILDERLVLVVNVDHPLATWDQVAVSALDGLPMVMLAKSFCTRRLWEDSARLAAAQPNVMMEMNTVSSILAIVERSELATVLPEMTLQQSHQPQLVGIPLVNPTLSRQVALLWHQHYYRCAISQAFSAMAHQHTAGWQTAINS